VPPTAQIELLAFPNIDEYGVFDIGAYMTQQLLAKEPFNGSTFQNLAGVYRVGFEYGSYYKGSYTASGSALPFYVTNGFAYFEQQINSYQKKALIDEAEGFMVPWKETILPGGTGSEPIGIYVFVGKSNGTVVRYRDDQLNTFVIDLSTLSITDVEDTVYRIPLNLAQVALTSGGAISPQRYMDVQVYNVPAVILDEVRIYYREPDFCFTNDDIIAYVNRYGAWDYLYMRGEVNEEVSQSRTIFNRRGAQNNPTTGELEIVQGLPLKGTVNIRGSKRFVMRTGYIRQEQNHQVEDLLMSKYHYSHKYDTNVILDTGSVSILTDNSSDLIAYEIEFELAGNVIQEIR
jgi:hypothetical protein